MTSYPTLHPRHGPSATRKFFVVSDNQTYESATLNMFKLPYDPNDLDWYVPHDLIKLFDQVQQPVTIAGNAPNQHGEDLRNTW